MLNKNSRLLEALGRGALITAAALMMAVSLAPYDFHILGIFGFALFVLAIWRAGLLATVMLISWGSFVYFLPSFLWLGKIGVEALLAPPLAYAAVSIPLGAVFYVATRVPGWPIWVSSLWVFRDVMIDTYPFGGSGWGQLGYGQVGTPLASFAAVGGVPLVTFVTCLIGAMVAYAGIGIANQVVNKKREPGQILLAPIVVVMAGIAAFLIPVPADGQTIEGQASANVTVVQGGPKEIPGLDPALASFSPKFAAHTQITRDYVLSLREKNEAMPDFIVWPEDAAGAELLQNPKADIEMQRVVNYLGRPILAGNGTFIQGEGWVNASVLWEPRDGATSFYFKRHLVPFAEYLPLAGVAKNVFNRFLLSREFLPGNKPGLFDINGVAISSVICFEISSGTVVREAVLEGGRAIVLQASNFGFIYLGQAEQQFSIARFRAIEHGRSVIVAGITGPSGAIAPNGEVLAKLDEGEIGTVSAIIPLRDTLTIADRLGSTVGLILSVLWVIGVLIFFRTNRLLHRAATLIRSSATKE